MSAYAGVIAIALSACSFSDADAKGGRGPAPPSGEAAAAQEKTYTPMDAFRALAPPEGFKFIPLFANPIEDEDDRFFRLEQAVQALRNDFDTVTPSLVRMVAIEKDISDLVGQLQSLTGSNDTGGQLLPALPAPDVEPPQQIPREDEAGGTEPDAADTMAAEGPKATDSRVTPEAASEGELPPEDAASPNSTGSGAAVAPPLDLRPQQQAAASAAPPAAPPAAPATPSGPVVRGVRMADHKDKTRVVIDVSAKEPYTAEITKNGRLLVIDLSKFNWTGAKSWDAMSAQLVAGYVFEGGKLTLDLLYPSEIKTQSVLGSNGGVEYRIVIDLYSKEVHQ